MIIAERKRFHCVVYFSYSPSPVLRYSVYDFLFLCNIFALQASKLHILSNAYEYKLLLISVLFSGFFIARNIDGNKITVFSIIIFGNLPVL